jgi:uncharacterized membrane protein YdfJ with MMPL/SSD domain
VLLLAGALTATNLRSGFSFLDFVPEGASVRAAATALEQRFGGGLGETTQVLLEGDLAEPASWTLAAVVIGIGVDYTIHVTHRFQGSRREGLDVDAAISNKSQA